MPLAPSDAWKPFQPTAGDPWSLRHVAHLHRRAGFGATWSELARDLREGPEASVRRFLEPPPANSEVLAAEAMERAALSADHPLRLAAAWLYRMLYTPDPLAERMTLVWHGHFATSNRKVESTALMQGQLATFRRHALGNFAELLADVIRDPAMLVWLDGIDSRPEKPNENFAREFLELFTLGPGNYTEADVRAAARAFVGWTRRGDAFIFDDELADRGPKTFLGQTGPWGAQDIVRIVLAQPAVAKRLCGRLYVLFVSDVNGPPDELVEPLAEVLRRRWSIRDVVATILASQHFFSLQSWRKKIKSPVDHSVGLLRQLGIPKTALNLEALAETCHRQGQELLYPPSVKGWDGGKSWLTSTALVERSRFAASVVLGEPELAMPPFDPLAWAQRERVSPDRLIDTWTELLTDGALDRTAQQALASDGDSSDHCRRLLRLLHSAEFQLA
jgi:uncharacterized protein (DUF1800 family)